MLRVRGVPFKVWMTAVKEPLKIDWRFVDSFGPDAPPLASDLDRPPS
jgi:hypothetical protein